MTVKKRNEQETLVFYFRHSGNALIMVMALMVITAIAFRSIFMSIDAGNLAARLVKRATLFNLLRSYAESGIDCAKTNAANPSCTSSTVVAARASNNSVFIATPSSTVGQFQLRVLCGTIPKHYQVEIKGPEMPDWRGLYSQSDLDCDL